MLSSFIAEFIEILYITASASYNTQRFYCNWKYIIGLRFFIISIQIFFPFFYNRQSRNWILNPTSFFRTKKEDDTRLPTLCQPLACFYNFTTCSTLAINASIASSFSPHISLHRKIFFSSVTFSLVLYYLCRANTFYLNSNSIFV